MIRSDIAKSLTETFAVVAPEALLLLFACLLFVGATFRAGRNVWGTVALVGLLVAGIALWITAARVPTIEAHTSEFAVKTLAGKYQAAKDAEAQTQVLAEFNTTVRPVETAVFAAPVLQTRLGLLVRALALVAGLVFVLFVWNEVPERRAAEYHACLLVMVIGLGLAAAANDLVALFLALELISIPTYVVLYLQRTDRPAQEAAAKYFLLSIFSSGLLLFGFSYLYGMTGTTNIPGVLDALGRGANHLPVLALVSLVMIVAGLGFKITAVPFHFYAPDVYQGTTPAAAALLAFIPKAAGFFALIRVLGFVRPETELLQVLHVLQQLASKVRPDNLTELTLPAPGTALGPQVPILFWILAAMTMTVGNVLAVLQNNLRRLLAYSSVAHAGYMLIGLAVTPDLKYGNTTISGVEAVLFYLAAYGAMTVGAFAVFSYLSTPERPIETVDDLAGLSASQPGVALFMVLFLFSLLGMPPTPGFWGKFLIFFGALAVPEGAQFAEHARLFRWLALIGAINAAIGAWYYLRMVGAMYLRAPVKPIHPVRRWPSLATIWLCAALTLALCFPWPMLKAARAAVFPEVPAGPQAQR